MWRTLQNVFSLACSIFHHKGMLTRERDIYQAGHHVAVHQQYHLCCRRHPLTRLNPVRLSENRKMVEMVEKFSTWASLKLVLNPQKFANPWFIVRWIPALHQSHQSMDRSHRAFFASAFALEHDFSKVVRVDYPWWESLLSQPHYNYLITRGDAPSMLETISSNQPFTVLIQVARLLHDQWNFLKFRLFLELRFSQKGAHVGRRHVQAKHPILFPGK